MPVDLTPDTTYTIRIGGWSQKGSIVIPNAIYKMETADGRYVFDLPNGRLYVEKIHLLVTQEEA